MMNPIPSLAAAIPLPGSLTGALHVYPDPPRHETR